MTGEVTVVGLGKIGLPLAVQIAGKGFRVHGADRNPDVTTPRGAGPRLSPASPDWPSACGQWSRRACSPPPPTPGAPWRKATWSSSSCRWSPTRRAGRITRLWTRPPPPWRPDCRLARWSVYETTLPVHTTRRRLARPSPRDPACSPAAISCSATARSGYPAGGLRGPAPVPQARRRDRRGAAARGAEASTSPSWTSMSARTCPARMAYGISAAPRPPSSPSWPRPPTATSTSRWPTNSPGSPRQPGIDVYRGHRGRQQPALQPPAPAGNIRRRALHPGLPEALPRRRSGRAAPAVAREVNEAVPAGGASAGRPDGRAVGAAGCRARRGLPGRCEGDGVFRRFRDRARTSRPARRSAGARPALQRRGAPRAWLRALSPWRAMRRGDHAHRSSRIRVARADQCPASGRWWMAAPSPTPAAGPASPSGCWGSVQPPRMGGQAVTPGCPPGQACARSRRGRRRASAGPSVRPGTS